MLEIIQYNYLNQPGNKGDSTLHRIQKVLAVYVIDMSSRFL